MEVVSVLLFFLSNSVILYMNKKLFHLNLND
jgi:hypothetical protein